jgi:hypothetical protein
MRRLQHYHRRCGVLDVHARREHIETLFSHGCCEGERERSLQQKDSGAKAARVSDIRRAVQGRAITSTGHPGTVPAVSSNRSLSCLSVRRCSLLQPAWGPSQPCAPCDCRARATRDWREIDQAGEGNGIAASSPVSHSAQSLQAQSSPVVGAMEERNARGSSPNPHRRGTGDNWTFTPQRHDDDTVSPQHSVSNSASALSLCCRGALLRSLVPCPGVVPLLPVFTSQSFRRV